MDDPITQTTFSIFLRLPTEIRLAIYEAYFALDVGEVKVGSPEKNSTRLPRADSALALGELEGRVHHHRFRHDSEPVRAQGPPGLLLTSRFVYTEAIGAFMRSKTYRFSNVRDMQIFALKSGAALSSYVRSIIIDYAHRKIADEVCSMLHAASRLFTKLETLTIDVSFPVNEHNTEFLQDVIFHCFENRSIKASGIFILDFVAEKAFDEWIEERAPECPMSERKCYSAIGGRQWVLRAELDKATDCVRERLRAHRYQGNEEEYVPLELVRGGLAREYLLSDGGNVRNMAQPYDLSYRGIVGTFVLRGRTDV